jgi:hypothetical protein
MSRKMLVKTIKKHRRLEKQVFRYSRVFMAISLQI